MPERRREWRVFEMIASLLLSVFYIYVCKGVGEGLRRIVGNDAEGLNEKRRRVYIGRQQMTSITIVNGKEVRICVNLNVSHCARKTRVQENIDAVADTKLFMWRTASSW